MTCIVGLVDKDKVYIGGDSAASSGFQISIRKDPKVFKVGEFIFGCEGSFRMIQLLKYSFIPPRIKYKDISKYLCTEFADEIKKLMKEGMSENEGSKFGSFLIGYKNRLFEFDDDLQLGENLNGMEAIGCGGDIALGALFATVGNLPEARIKKALEASASFSTGVAAPFHVIST